MRYAKILALREVVIKTIGPELANEPAFIRDFESTARLLGARRHPNIVPVYDFWREPDAAYFVTGWVDGSRLETLLRDEQLNPVERAAILDQVAAALDAVHRRGLGHGSLDGSKVIIDRTGTAVVVGFGPSRHESGETLDEAVELGLVSPLDTEATALAMLAFLEGVILLAKTRNDPVVVRTLGPAIKTLRIELAHKN